MKLHSDTLTKSDVFEAAAYARSLGHDIWVDTASDRGSRSRAHGVILYCESHTGRRQTNGRGGYAASWTAWGWLIAELFHRDPHAIIGYYDGVGDFRRQCEEMVEHRKRYGDNIEFLSRVASSELQSEDTT